MTDRNFGNQRYGTISGLKFEDHDGSGAQEAGEDGLAGVTINLLDTNGVVLRTDVTATDGSYEFLDVAPGDYRVSENVPTGFQQTLPDVGQGGYYPVTMPLEGEAEGLDFGNQPLVGSIFGVKWNDEDSDGFRRDFEVGIAGVTIELVDANGQVVRTTTTIDGAPDTGYYEFLDVPEGLYTVREIVPPGYVQTAPLPSTVHTVNVIAGMVHGGNDFGNVLVVSWACVTVKTCRLTTSAFRVVSPSIWTLMVTVNWMTRKRAPTRITRVDTFSRDWHRARMWCAKSFRKAGVSPLPRPVRTP